MKKIFLKLIKFYQTGVSPLKPPCCRFAPTCSEYARQALVRHGIFFGAVLSVYRLLRCNPLCKPGYDPVPEKIFAKKIKNKKIKEKQVELIK